MPSPIGHTLAGVAVALVAERLRRPPDHSRQAPWPSPAALATIAALAAALPDADLLLSTHRGWTHSVGATVLVMIVAAAVTGWVTRSGTSQVSSHRAASRPKSVAGHRAVAGSPVGGVWVVVLVCGAAHASHILLDWLGADWYNPPGIQALWPFSDDWFISGWDVFARVERRDPLSWPTMISNLKAGVREVALMVPVVAAAWWLSQRTGDVSRDDRAQS